MFASRCRVTLCRRSWALSWLVVAVCRQLRVLVSTIVTQEEAPTTEFDPVLLVEKITDAFAVLQVSCCFPPLSTLLPC
jgi:hypothetical protein